MFYFITILFVTVVSVALLILGDAEFKSAGMIGILVVLVSVATECEPYLRKGGRRRG